MDLTLWGQIFSLELAIGEGGWSEIRADPCRACNAQDPRQQADSQDQVMRGSDLES